MLITLSIFHNGLNIRRGSFSLPAAGLCHQSRRLTDWAWEVKACLPQMERTNPDFLQFLPFLSSFFLPFIRYTERFHITFPQLAAWL